MFRIDHHVIEKELRRFAQHGISALLEKGAVPGESEMFPKMRADPDAASRMHTPAETPAGRGEAPRIREDVADPAARAVNRSRRPPPRLAQRLDQAEERLVALGEVADFSDPIILLGVDIEMKIAGPTHVAREVVVPETLQVGWERGVLARPRDEQVTTVLKEERGQRGIVLTLADSFQPLSGGERHRGGRTQFNRDPTEERLMIVDVALAQRGVTPPCRRRHLLFALRSRRRPLKSGVERDQESDRIGVVDLQRVALRRHFAAVRNGANPSDQGNAGLPVTMLFLASL